MRRYWQVYRTFFASSFVRELEFKANFLAKIGQNAMWVGFFVLVLLVIYRNTPVVAGWNRGEALVLGATVFTMNALHNALFFSLTEIPEQVRRGTLDFVVTRPIDSQFWVSLRRFNFDQIGSLLAGVGLLAWGVLAGGLSPSPLQWLSFTVMLLAATILFYCFNLALMTTGIWFVRIDNLSVLSESVMNVARFPVDIYGAAAARVLTFLVPLGLLAYAPARQLARGFEPSLLIAEMLWTGAALIATRWFWRHALRSYSSASS